MKRFVSFDVTVWFKVEQKLQATDIGQIGKVTFYDNEVREIRICLL